MGIDRVLLDALYRGRLRGLRNRAEEAGLSKSGSVEVVRARLIQHHILGDDDLSWEGIQSMTHKEIGQVLKVLGLTSSGYHHERLPRPCPTLTLQPKTAPQSSLSTLFSLTL